MTTPDVPLRAVVEYEVPGTPEQIWEAIATAEGIGSWFMRTDLDGRVGGAIVTHMGEELSSPGTVIGWNPPHRFAYEEPDWAELSGHPGAVTSPLVTEFLVEATSGGSCVVRIVSSAFGTGADWEAEFLDQLRTMWKPFLDNLRLYLTNFPGQRVTSLSAQATVPRPRDEVWSAMRRELGVVAVGLPVETRGIVGSVERIGAVELLLRVSSPVQGFLQFGAVDQGDGSTWTQLEGYLFSANAPDYVAQEQAGWKEWLQGLAVPA
jgi:uncharacterized protein YndB with AHSA1/START domain